jgi:hypothetical protein
MDDDQDRYQAECELAERISAALSNATFASEDDRRLVYWAAGLSSELTHKGR